MNTDSTDGKRRPTINSLTRLGRAILREYLSMMKDKMSPIDESVQGLSRRRFLAGTAAGVSAAALNWPKVEAEDKAAKPALKRVAAINSIYRLKSHAYHIAGRFI